MTNISKLLSSGKPLDDALDAAIDAAGGPAAFRAYLPYGGNLDVLATKYGQDKHFNQSDMAGPYVTVWDRAAGFREAGKPIQPPTYEPDGGGPHRLLQSRGVAPLSMSQAVALLKRAATRLLADAGKIPPEPDQALILQPYQDVLAGRGPLPDIRRRFDMLRSTDPETIYVLVPLAVGLPGGLSRRQARDLMTLLSDPEKKGMVSAFYEHLCLDDDVRPWIDKMTKGGTARGD